MLKNSYLYINGLRVHYMQWGSPTGNNSLVLLHGLASNARIWELTAQELEASGFHIIAPDARGHGLTDDSNGEYNFNVYRTDLVSFLDTLALDRPTLIGHSWGANRVLDYAAHFSIGTRSPSRIVLVDGGMSQLNFPLPGYPAPTWESTLERLTPPSLAGLALEDLEARIREMTRSWGIRLDLQDQVTTIILGNFSVYLDESSGQERIAPHLRFENHLKIIRSLWEFHTFDYYDRVRCPILMIPARAKPSRSVAEDMFLAAKETGIRLAIERIKNLDVSWFDNTIHDIPLQRPLELSKAIANFCVEPKY